MTVTVKSKGAPPHWCARPGAWRRWRLGLSDGAVIECDECGARWQFSAFGGPLGDPEWTRCEPSQPDAPYASVTETAPSDHPPAVDDARRCTCSAASWRDHHLATCPLSPLYDRKGSSVGESR